MPTYLTDELFVRLGVTFGPNGLLQEGQKNRDDDTGLKAFSETNEEYFKMSLVSSHKDVLKRKIG